jgi:molybdopterin-binding protein
MIRPSVAKKDSDRAHALRIGEAAELLGVSVPTLRRWETAGRIRSARSEGGQRTIALAEVERLHRGRRAAARPVVVAQSARNHFDGVVTRVERDKVAAIVELRAGPHRIVSLVTREAVDELRLEVGDHAVAVVKATNVMVELAGDRRRRGKGETR